MAWTFHANFPGCLPDNAQSIGSWEAAKEDARLWLDSELDMLEPFDEADEFDLERIGDAKEALAELDTLDSETEWCACVGVVNLSIVECDETEDTDAD